MLSVARKHVLATVITRQTPSSDFADFIFNKKRQFHQVQVLNWRIQLLWTALQVWIFTLRRWISIVCCYSGLTRFWTFQLVSDYSKTYYSKISNLRLNNRLVTHFFFKPLATKCARGTVLRWKNKPQETSEKYFFMIFATFLLPVFSLQKVFRPIASFYST